MCLKKLFQTVNCVAVIIIIIIIIINEKINVAHSPKTSRTRNKEQESLANANVKRATAVHV